MIGRREASNSCTDDDHLEPIFFWHRRHLSSKPTKNSSLSEKKSASHRKCYFLKTLASFKNFSSIQKIRGSFDRRKKLIAAKNIFLRTTKIREKAAAASDRKPHLSINSRLKMEFDTFLFHFEKKCSLGRIKTRRRENRGNKVFDTSIGLWMANSSASR